MPNPATLREHRLRMTKAQLIDEIDTLEQRSAATPEGGSELKRREQELAEKESQLRLVLDSMPGLPGATPSKFRSTQAPAFRVIWPDCGPRYISRRCGFLVSHARRLRT